MIVKFRHRNIISNGDKQVYEKVWITKSKLSIK